MAEIVSAEEAEGGADVPPEQPAVAPPEEAQASAVAVGDDGVPSPTVRIPEAPTARRPESARRPEAEDKNPRAFVEAQARGRSAGGALKERAKQLLAQVRGDPGEAPSSGAVVQASPLSFGAPSAARAPSPAGLAVLNAAGPEFKLSGGLIQQAVSKFRIGDLAGAESLLTRHIEEAPRDPLALRHRALVRREMRRFEPSAEDARRALELAPRDSRARRVLLDDLVDLGRSNEALELAERALKDDPRDAQTLAARARVWESLGKPERSLADLKAAAQLDAQFDSAYQDARGRASSAPSPQRPRSGMVWLGAVGTALFFFAVALFRKRGETSVRLALRAEDHDLFARGARPDAVPKGFQLLRTLGQGGMGIVYEAMDVALQRAVALKKLRAEVADNPRERARFLKEARTVAALRHPNIVQIHAIHEDEGGLFLVFEKVPGETLHERLGRGLLPPAEAVAVLRQVAQALDYAHSQGVVHQDLKPANVMVSGEHAMVMDFGIARRVAETLSALSKVEVVGTPAYMAPEQELGGRVGPAADIFALGACAYELICGRPPFASGSMMQKVQRVYRPASEAAPGLPRAADAVIARALEPEPGARWPSAAAFAEALARSLS